MAHNSESLDDLDAGNKWESKWSHKNRLRKKIRGMHNARNSAESA